MKTALTDQVSGYAQPSAALSRIIGWASAPMPLGPAQAGLARLSTRLADRYPALVERLCGLAGSVVQIEPAELSVCLLVHIEESGLKLSMARKDVPGATARIRGPLAVLAAMLRGSMDGDAAFFARELSIEGDTSAVIALRNAIDGAAIDLVEEGLAIFGPVAPLVRRAGAALLRLDAAMCVQATRLRNIILLPVVARLDAVEPKMARYDRRLDDLVRKSGASAGRRAANP